jgi:threonine synthase
MYDQSFVSAQLEQEHMNFSLRCHLCQTAFPATALWVCDRCLGPLEVTYDYAAIAPTVSRETIERRPQNLWRYRELLPIAGDPRTGLHSGFTPLVRANRLAARLGVRELYVKDDSVNHPSCSYKDRVVSIAATRAVELGFTASASRSTSSFPTTSRLARSPARASIGRGSWRSTATMTM